MEPKPKRTVTDFRARALVRAIVLALGASQDDLVAAEAAVFEGTESVNEIATDLVRSYTSGPRAFVRSVVAALGGNQEDQGSVEASVFEGADHYPNGAEIERRVMAANDLASAAAATREDELPAQRALAAYLGELNVVYGDGETDVAVALRLLRARAEKVRELSDRVHTLEAELHAARRAALPAEVFRLVDQALGRGT